MSQGGVEHAAKAWMDALWAALDKRILSMLHPHHVMHEPGGKDMVRIPLTGLEDVYADTPEDDDLIAYDEATDSWQLHSLEDLGGGGGGGEHEAYLGVFLPATSIPKGPKNLSTTDKYILNCNVVSDGHVAGSASPGMSFDVAAGGNEDAGEDAGVMRSTWSSGTRLSVSITDVGDDASYVGITWLVSDV